MSFYKKFRKAKFKEAKLDVVETPPITAVLTFEQPLFHRIKNPEDIDVYRSLQRKIKSLYYQWRTLGKYLERKVRSVDEVAELEKKCRELSRIRWNSRIEITKEFLDEYRQEHERLGKLEEKVKETKFPKIHAKYRKLVNYQEALQGKISDISLSITAESPLDTLKVYGVLDYTRSPGFHTWDESRTGSVIGFLSDKLIDELRGENIKKIILFSGLHAREHPYNAASYIAGQLSLPKGVVQVYSTGYAEGRVSDRVEVLHKERRHLEAFMQSQGLPRDVASIEIMPGPKVGDILARIK
ncbi:hypothetical protein KY330_04030 [Candidatus Woesearchaeota archaeon]|nr:hypothetical protein [Candidatus Woesearchaeota archaeon]